MPSRATLIVCVIHALAFTPATWRVEKTITTPVTTAFRDWFEKSPQALPSVIEANDFIENVESLGGDDFRATVRSTSFGIVTLVPKMIFKVVRDEEALVMDLLEQKMEAEGPKWACRLVLACSGNMQTKSQTRIRCMETERGTELEANSLTVVTMKLPRWIPIPRKRIEEGGQTSIQKQITGDLEGMLEALSTREL